MRGLAIVTDVFDRRGGGREQYVADLSGALVELGWEVDVLAWQSPPDEEATGRFTLRRIGGPRMFAARALAAAIARYRRDHPLRPVLATGPLPGATHCQLHSGVSADAFAAERASFGSPLRRACFWPALRLNLRRQRRLRDESQVLSHDGTAAVMTFSAAQGEAICWRFGIDRARVRVAPLGVDRSRFHARNRTVPPGTPIQLLFAGHNFRLKGLTAAMSALATVRATGLDARLVVAGNGAIRAARRLAHNLGVASVVEFAGNVPQAEMPRLYRASHVLVHPTFYDPFPRVVIEALACGTPVITTAACGVSEHLTSGRHGFLVSNAGDIADLVNAIGACAEPGRWAALSTACAELGARFDFARHVGEVVDWLTAEPHVSAEPHA